MCDKESCCEHPEKKVKDPKECSPEQIAECHPESENHPCEKQSKQQDTLLDLTHFKLVPLLKRERRV